MLPAQTAGKSRLYMEELRTWGINRYFGNNLIFVYQGQWQIFPHFANIVYHLLKLVDILSLISPGNVDNELEQAKRAMHILNSDLVKCEKMHIPGTDMERSFVIVKKNAPIPKKYPRKAGTPGKEPLG